MEYQQCTVRGYKKQRKIAIKKFMLFWGPTEVESIKCLKPYPGYFDHYIAPTIGQQFLWSVMIEKVSIKRLDLYNLNMRQRENVLKQVNNKGLGGAQYIYGDSDYIDLTERTDYFENRQQVGHNCSMVFLHIYLIVACLHRTAHILK